MSNVFLPKEAARLVLSYLHDNELQRTIEVFMSECPALAGLSEIIPQHVLQGCKVRGRSLSDILTAEYSRSTDIHSFVWSYETIFRLIKQIIMLCGISGEEYIHPLELLSLVARHLTPVSSSPVSSSPVVASKMCQTEQRVAGSGEREASPSVTDESSTGNLGRVINETMNMVTADHIMQRDSSTPTARIVRAAQRKRKTADTLQSGRELSKKVKKQEDDLLDFRRKFGSVVSSAKDENIAGENMEMKIEGDNFVFSLSPDILYSLRNNIKMELKQDFDEICTVFERTVKPEEPKSFTRRGKCRTCPGCKAPPCNQCRPCRDKKANGGRGTLKKGCIYKQCLNLKPGKESKPGGSRSILNPQYPTAAPPQILPGLAELIPASVLPQLPVGYTSLGFSVMSHQNNFVSPVENVGSLEKSGKNDAENNDIATEL